MQKESKKHFLDYIGIIVPIIISILALIKGNNAQEKISQMKIDLDSSTVQINTLKTQITTLNNTINQIMSINLNNSKTNNTGISNTQIGEDNKNSQTIKHLAK